MDGQRFRDYRAIDVDTHITEPADVWTARVSSRWGKAVPHIEREDGVDYWTIGDRRLYSPAAVTMAGFDGSPPDHRRGYDDIPRSAFDAKARLEHMDVEGIHAQVLYPNLGGFGSAAYLQLGSPVLALECLRAYNDFLVEWCSADPERLIPVAALPFWDLDEAVREVFRTTRLGHRGINLCMRPEDHGAPPLRDRHWDRLWSAIDETGLPVSFHIGGGDTSGVVDDRAGIGMRANMARFSTLLFVGNADCIAEIIFGGVCHRFPKLRFVSVESGVGWLPGFLEAADWQWANMEVRKEHPEYDLRPSEYFRRQIYGCFWFERHGLDRMLSLYPDNVLWETDFPHPTCQHPGLKSGLAERPADYVESALASQPAELCRKVLHGNAAALYGIGE
ncbi:MAG: amidohydrolase family protein [Myxococcota bacterium]